MGVSMRLGRLSTAIFIFLLIGIFTPVSAGGWSGGYRIALDGYDSVVFTDREHVVLSVVYEPFGSAVVHPQLQFGVIVPTFPSNSSTPLMTVGFASGLFVLQEHPFERLFRRDSALVPKIEASITYDVSRTEFATTSVVFQPISFHYGDKYIGILGVSAVRDLRNGSWGWAVRLFEITHYLW